MSLEKKIMIDIKDAMLSKNQLKLEVCRSIKSAIILAKTKKGSKDITESIELDILQKLLKQRRESSKIYYDQKRLDLAKQEQDQAKIIEHYLPEPYSLEELENLILTVMEELGVDSKKHMGRVIAEVMSRAKGRSDGKTISQLVSNKLT